MRTSCASGLRVMAMTSPIFILLRRMYGAAAAQACQTLHGLAVFRIGITGYACNNLHHAYCCYVCRAYHRQLTSAKETQHPSPVFSMTYTRLFSPPLGQDLMMKVHSVSLASSATCDRRQVCVTAGLVSGSPTTLHFLTTS